MKNPEVNRVMEMLSNTYNGSAWHGASMLEILKGIDAVQAFQATDHIHRICELVQHITTWRIYAIKKLEGDKQFDVSKEDNWKSFDRQDEEAWKDILTQLDESQTKLISALKHFPDEKLQDTVPGKAYDFYTLIHGVIQHDLYHLGEIALLARELNE